ncbi:collagenase [Shewanella fidelis]|uniref:Collagenase n=1 Tax=Shewanella fidelis TaxID=173509 RepID=A0AAW8NTC9_9GAMM|nr:collagenase [Shewanella fidelis]MDR8525831.1 collagenase [Shewanella fidelis]MDW4813922.1 collagenase [Shewanella fidelis]MDW4818077.1 collagenase [Shewanella fidelis]MDW4822085.1 collagenase [Shewanella fidelis]MDW4826310.1 collagenase [Shewanella fidelis]
MTSPSKLSTTIIATLLVTLSGCSNHIQQPINQQLINQISSTSEADLFNAQNPLLTKDTFLQASITLGVTENTDTIDQLLYYFRAFSYYGPTDELTEKEITALATALEQLVDSGRLNNQPRLQEQYAVTLYRYFASNDAALALAPLLPQLGVQLQQLASSSASLTNDYGLLETLKAYGFLLNKARKDMDGELNKTLISADLDSPLLAFAASSQSIRADKDWPLTNAYWALALYRLSLPSSEDGEPTEQELAIDNAVSAIAKADVVNRGNAAKDAYTAGFHVNVFAGQELCENNSDICRIPELKTALPIEHHCSDSLFILTQDLNEQELAESCTKLTSQESSFHSLLETGLKPTPNDFNTALRVVAFKNWSQYHLYGQLIFDINTDNGGMYIEGTPSKPGNQATFFAYRQWWIEPEFKVWNLNHEYVHYLDGHFVKYAGFGHFPSKMVWWSEGLAEYVSKGDNNPSALRVIKRDINEAPTLEEIFATEYKDGQDRTYKWSYMAIRFLAENHHQEFVQLSKYLKTDYFEGYEQLMQSLTAHQAQFSDWLTVQVEAFDDIEADSKPRLHKQGRYDYRDYLQPQHLAHGANHLKF